MESVSLTPRLKTADPGGVTGEGEVAQEDKDKGGCPPGEDDQDAGPPAVKVEAPSNECRECVVVIERYEGPAGACFKALLEEQAGLGVGVNDQKKGNLEGARRGGRRRCRKASLNQIQIRPRPARVTKIRRGRLGLGGGFMNRTRSGQVSASRKRRQVGHLRMFICGTCGGGFKTRAGLVVHSRSHGGLPGRSERFRKCRWCGKGIRAPGGSHVRLHVRYENDGGCAADEKGVYICARSYKPKMGRGRPKKVAPLKCDGDVSVPVIPVPVVKSELPETRPCLIRLSRCDDIAVNPAAPSTPPPPPPVKTEGDRSMSTESSNSAPIEEPVPLKSGPALVPDLPSSNLTNVVDLDQSPEKLPEQLPEQSPEKLTEKLPEQSPQKLPEQSPEQLPAILSRMRLRSDSKPSPPSVLKLASASEDEPAPPLLSLPALVDSTSTSQSTPPQLSPHGPSSKSGYGPLFKKTLGPMPSSSEPPPPKPPSPQLLPHEHEPSPKSGYGPLFKTKLGPVPSSSKPPALRKKQGLKLSMPSSSKPSSSKLSSLKKASSLRRSSSIPPSPRPSSSKPSSSKRASPKPPSSGPGCSTSKPSSSKPSSLKSSSSKSSTSKPSSSKSSTSKPSSSNPSSSRRSSSKRSSVKSRFWDPKLMEVMAGPSETIALEVEGDPNRPNKGRITVDIRKDLLAHFLF